MTEPRFKGVTTAGLLVISAAGWMLVCIGVYARSAGWWPDRPARPYWNIGVGAVIVFVSIAEIVRRRMRP